MNTTSTTILAGSIWNVTGVSVKVWSCARNLAVIFRFYLLLFSQFELCHFWDRFLPKHIDTGYLVNATPPTILAWSFWNLAGMFVNVWKCAWRLTVILRLIFVTFLQFGLSYFLAWLQPKHIITWYLVNATSHTMLAGTSWNFAGVKVWRCAWGFGVILRLFLLLFLQFELCHFWIRFLPLGILWTQLLLQF